MLSFEDTSGIAIEIATVSCSSSDLGLWVWQGEM
jgi:hypothetical protein